MSLSIAVVLVIVVIAAAYFLGRKHVVTQMYAAGVKIRPTIQEGEHAVAYVEFQDEVSGAVPASMGGKPGLVTVRYQAPPDPEGQGRAAVGYLKSSGDVHFVHPNTGEVYLKSDQKWVYDLDEGATLAKKYPLRFVAAKG